MTNSASSPTLLDAIASNMLYGFMVLLAIGLIAVALLAKRKNGLSRANASQSWQVYSKPILTPRELKFFEILTYAIGDAPFQICPQCSMSAFIGFKGEGSASPRGTYRARYSDFVLINEASKVVLVVEVDDSSHKGNENKDAARDAVLASAGIPTLRIPAGRLPTVDALKTELLRFRIQGLGR